MDLHERQQVDFLLQVAVERFVERTREIGEERAKLDDFTNAIFNDFLLGNADGACFILRGLSRRPAPAVAAGSVEESLIIMAKAVFSDLLRQKAEEALSRGY